MQQRIILLPILIVVYSAATNNSAETNCDQNGVLVYEDLGCKSEIVNNGCPVKFSCDNLHVSQPDCYFHGKIYKDGEDVEDERSSPSCHKACRCNNKTFTCAILDCPEWLGYRAEPGCHLQYKLGGCCSAGQLCANDSLAECVFRGKTYKEGERFAPNDKCMECVCGKNFTEANFESFCARSSCGNQLFAGQGEKIRTGCAPFYREEGGGKLCCPSFWICENGNEKIEGAALSEETCKFGSQVLKQGQSFTRLNEKSPYDQVIAKINCKCAIPPLVTCIGG